MITITGDGFTIGGEEKTTHTGAPPITITAGAAGDPIRISSSYGNVRNGGRSIAVQVEGFEPAALPPKKIMLVKLPAGRTIRIYERK